MQLEARLAGAGSGDKAAYERSMEAARAQYSDVKQKDYTPEEEASFEARRQEYTLDRYTQPTAEQLAEHKRKQELHLQEQQKKAKEQEQFEKHGKRRIDPTGGFSIDPGTEQRKQKSARLGPQGHQARTASIMRDPLGSSRCKALRLDQ